MDQLAQYLKSIRDEYAYVKDVYAPTDVSGDVTDSAALSSHSLQLEFMVQTATEKGALTKDLAAAQRTEKLNALEALKKYAPRHVLLKGRPGSGKTTALKRLLLESADQALAQESPSANIPIFLELKHYQTSIIDLIRNFMMHHGWLTDKGEVEKLLLERRLLLLVDGINELPSESARKDLQSFRTAYLADTPMICTTREIGVGAHLGTAKKLEMLPLTDSQVERFARAYLHEKADVMLQRLTGRLKDLVRTPLFLWMLCLVFAEKNETPLSIGAVFRRFTQTYAQTFRGDSPVTDESRRLWPDLLAHLAFCMIQGHEMAVSIPRQLGQQIIAEYLETRGVGSAALRAATYLGDLINHHLLEMTGEGSIQFVHQLVQEYFAAEYLLNSFPAINDEQLKRDYLNYHKWTEPVSLMLGLIDDLNEALRLVRVGLALSPMLGARLAGAAREGFHEETIKQVLQCDVPKKVKIELLGSTSSQEAVSLVAAGLHDEDKEVRSTVVRNLAQIGGATAAASLIDALKDEDKQVRFNAAWGLGRIGGDQASAALIAAAKDDDELLRFVIAWALSEISGNIAPQQLIDALKDSNPSVASTAALALGKIGDDRAANQLVEALKYGDLAVRTSAAVALRDLGCWWATEKIAHALRNDDPFVSGSAAWVLAQTGGVTATLVLIEALKDNDPAVASVAAWALGEIGDDRATEALIDALKDKDKQVRLNAAWALGKIGDARATEALIDILKDGDSSVSSSATVALVRIGGDRAKEVVVGLLKGDDLQVRLSAAFALGIIGDDRATEALIDTLLDKEPSVRSRAAEALGKIGGAGPAAALTDMLEDKESSVRSSVAEALGKIGVRGPLPRS
jgi:HEAT repeat protein